MITMEDYTKGRDKQYPEEWTPEVQANAIKLLDIVNKFLTELGIDEVEVTSGFRPAAINASLPNSAKRSYHQISLAIDLLDDKDQNLAKLISSRPDLLRKYSLWQENPNATKGKITNWSHIDLGVRQDRPSRIFNP